MAMPRGTGPFSAFPAYTWDVCFAFKHPDEVTNFIEEICNHHEMKTDRMVKKTAIIKWRFAPANRHQLVFTKPTEVQKKELKKADIELDPMILPLKGADLPQYTLFDLLGYCISRAVLFDPIVDWGSRPITAANFYLPLLSVYCRWSQALASGDNLPKMHSVTWVVNNHEFPTKVVLGSTIPSDGKKPEIQQDRLVRIVSASSIKGKSLVVEGENAYPMEVDKVTGQLVKQVGQLYGNCAESNQFIWYPFQLRGTGETIKGLAMNPHKAPRKTPYDAKSFSHIDVLRDPCVNCQRMLRVLLGEQGKTSTKPLATTANNMLSDYYEQLGKDHVMAAKQKALDKATSQNVLMYFGVTQLRKDVEYAINKPAGPMIKSFHP